jgi:hypothetical protein
MSRPLDSPGPSGWTSVASASPDGRSGTTAIQQLLGCSDGTAALVETERMAQNDPVEGMTVARRAQ